MSAKCCSWGWTVAHWEWTVAHEGGLLIIGMDYVVHRDGLCSS